MSIENLPNGHSYAGEVDVALKPSGNGTQFRPNGHVEYTGLFKNGFKQGRGTLFYENGNNAYRGNFKKGAIDGKGIMFYPSGKVLAGGTFRNGELKRGSILDTNGELLKKMT